jgi:hypothetical protein
VPQRQQDQRIENGRQHGSRKYPANPERYGDIPTERAQGVQLMAHVPGFVGLLHDQAAQHLGDP